MGGIPRVYIWWYTQGVHMVVYPGGDIGEVYPGGDIGEVYPGGTGGVYPGWYRWCIPGYVHRVVYTRVVHRVRYTRVLFPVSVRFERF